MFQQWCQARLAFAAALFAAPPYPYWYVAKPTAEHLSPRVLLENIWCCRCYLADLAILLKSQLTLFFPIGILLLISPFDWRWNVGAAVVALLICPATLSPWMMRYYRLLRNATWESLRELSFHRRGETPIAADRKARLAQMVAAGAERIRADKYTVEPKFEGRYSHQVGRCILAIGLSLLPIMALCLGGMRQPFRGNSTIFEIQFLAIICVSCAGYNVMPSMGRYMHLTLPLKCCFSILRAQSLLSRWRRQQARITASVATGMEVLAESAV